MKVGIIVYSQTGNTLSVAEKLQERMAAAGHSVQLERVIAMDEGTRAKKIELKNSPDTSP